jgi:hypothetical protein
MPASPDTISSWSERPSSFLPSWTRSVLSDALRQSSRLNGLTYEIFVQGSYVNETNVRGDSDVDLVVEMKMPFEQQIEQLSSSEHKRFDDRYEESRYDWHDFDVDILAALRENFWATKHSKCIDIMDWDSALRLPADILPTLEHREYSGFSSSGQETYQSGVFFRDQHGNKIVSYPRQHLRNGQRKDQNTGGRYKEAVRVFKNARRYLCDNGTSVDGVSSYLIECLLYNVPDQLFRDPLPDVCASTIRWLLDNDDAVWSRFMCQNEIYPLFDEAHLAGTRTFVTELHPVFPR